MKTIASQTTEQYTQTGPQDADIVIEAGAQLEHGLIGNCEKQVVRIKRDAFYSPVLLNSQETEQVIHLEIHLDEPGAEVDLKGFVHASDSMSIDHTVTIVHHAEQTSSNQYVKSIADNKSKVKLISNVKLEQSAKQASADQLTKSLLLSEQAEIEAKPILEVDQDDVKASHGASIGSLDKQALFFLQSRGLSKTEAEQTLLTAFMQEMKVLIPQEFHGYMTQS